MPYKCFLIEPTDTVLLEASVSWPGCAKSPWGDATHRASREVLRGTRAEVDSVPLSESWEPFSAVCEWCGAATGLLRPQSTSSGSFWRRVDTGEVKRRIADFGIGAMWFATWYERGDTPPGQVVQYGWDWDNQYEPPLMVATPGGDWNIDSRASNCTLKDDRLHRCWVRHGTPPNITVGKAGFTCAAGAGSIQSGTYHGFLRDGQFT
jgi:hypothetical protein